MALGAAPVTNAIMKRPPPRRIASLLLALLAPIGAALAQATAGSDDGAAWRSCSALTDDATARLACFDQWAAQQPARSAPAKDERPDAAWIAAPTPTPANETPLPPMASAHADGCRDPQYSDLARFWELEPGSSCGRLSFRGYRPISVSLVATSYVNRQPMSDAASNSASEATPYRRAENRIQLSVRTKLAQGLFTQRQSDRLDSLWFGYTQQSYWQLFTPEISRPFRATDHEPELVYIYPTLAQLPWGWRWRYAGLGLVHQSNGQSKPLSRSWNRVYLMTGVELGRHWALGARVWQRVPERAGSDDNPGISDYIGRGELTAFWNIDQDNSLSTSLRHSLSTSDRGSVRVEWLRALGNGPGGKSNLRLHTALFSGYGDSMIDYNRKRSVFSVGLSLVDF